MQGETVHDGPSSTFVSRDLPKFLEGETGETGGTGLGELEGVRGCLEGVWTCTWYTDQIVRDSNILSLCHK